MTPLEHKLASIDAQAAAADPLDQARADDELARDIAAGSTLSDRELSCLVLVKCARLQQDVDAFKALAASFATLGSGGMAGILGSMLRMG